MESKNSVFKKGNKCYILTYFPLSFSLNDEPINIADGIYLTKLPIEKLKNHTPKQDAVSIATTEWIFPGFHFGYDENSANLDNLACIIIDTSINQGQPDNLFWYFVGSMLMIKPLPIYVGGNFNIGTPQQDFITEFGKFDLRSNLHLAHFPKRPPFLLLNYDMQDIEKAKKIFQIFCEYFVPQKERRFSYNLQTWLSTMILDKLNHRSPIYTALFSILDSITGNPSGKHSDIISSRLGRFLSDIPFDHLPLKEPQITSRIKYIWELHRYPEIHGHIKENICPPQKSPNLPPLFSSDKDLNDLADLAEIGRIALLKTLLLENDNKKEYLQIPIPPTGKSKSDAKKDNQERDRLAHTFFSKFHTNSEILCFYTNLEEIK